jgi:hypothetical protein
MKIVYHVLSRNGCNAVLDWILKNLIDGTSYHLGYFDNINMENTRLLDQDRKIIKKESFYDSSLVFFAVENIDIQEPYDKNEVISFIVLRDFYNAYASFKRLSRNPILSGLNEIDYPNLWVKYAREFAGETSYLKNKIFINYNKWFASEDYRKRILSVIRENGIPTIIDGTPNLKVAKQGFGSSFDEINFENRANQMKVTERYKKYLTDEEYVKTCSRKDIQELNLKIFNITPPEFSSEKKNDDPSMSEEILFQSIFYQK